MKQIYYVIRTLLRGHGSNVIKILSLALGLTMSILLFARVAFEQSFDKCFKDYDNLYQIFSVFSANGQTFEPRIRTADRWRVPYWRIFLKKWRRPPAIAFG